MKIAKTKAKSISFALELVLKTWDEGGNLSSSTAGVCFLAKKRLDSYIKADDRRRKI